MHYRSVAPCVAVLTDCSPPPQTRNDMAKTLNNAAGGPSPDAWHHCTAEDGPDCYGPPHNATVADRAGAVEAASAARNNKGGPSPDAWHHCTAEDGSDCFGPPKHNVTVDVSDNASGVRGEGQHLDVNEQVSTARVPASRVVHLFLSAHRTGTPPSWNGS